MNENNNMIEVFLQAPDDFLKIKETLTRIGISNKEKTTLTQTCHILHKKGKYYIVHFKEMFSLDGKETSFHSDDVARRNAIAILLSDWGLLSLADGENLYNAESSMKGLTIIPYSEKGKWELKTKYTIGKK